MSSHLLHITLITTLFLQGATAMWSQEEGLASFYHTRFHGKRSASGRVHDQNDMVAAHRTYPFGTFLKVTNLTNNKSVIVCVTDRGPRQRKRIIDVSASAAEALGFKRQGITRVRVEEVPDEKERIIYELMYPKIPYLEINNSLPLIYDNEE
ncbi:MAG: septal ring lytic transglycosylase RlpA family protein [Parabacteroides sp.]|nr:septal ring lytic transglycosylase RlpA family protein [Parabacteroides sp.]